MGVVWKATDTTLGRDVAIKVLPEVFARDPDRMARFEREARMLAALNHPRIAAIYGVGLADGVRFLAMEPVDGEDRGVSVRSCAMPAAGAGSRGHRATDRRGPRVRSREGHHPPRSEAGKHQTDCGRTGQGVGLRARQGARG